MPPGQAGLSPSPPPAPLRGSPPPHPPEPPNPRCSCGGSRALDPLWGHGPRGLGGDSPRAPHFGVRIPGGHSTAGRGSRSTPKEHGLGVFPPFPPSLPAGGKRQIPRGGGWTRPLKKNLNRKKTREAEIKLNLNMRWERERDGEGEKPFPGGSVPPQPLSRPFRATFSRFPPLFSAAASRASSPRCRAPSPPLPFRSQRVCS